MGDRTPPLPAAKLHWFRRQLATWAVQHFRDFPWRHTTDPYAIFVAESLLQKTNAATVVPIYETFLARYPDLHALAAAPVAEVAALLQPLGLFFRAERLCQAVQVVLTKHGGRIPDTEAALLVLPGIGKYTARSICANAFGQPAAILDTNVARILERFFGIQGERVKSRCKLLWGAAEAAAPAAEVSRWNLTLLDFGALVCTARQPSCGACPLQKRCCYRGVGSSKVAEEQGRYE
ncbi:MAG: A/G-specific adenine glycosylase [Coleofasciculaceae cyanobacterium SM2_3_26]|nr:A/G-specific adenine glycosylase [Coleofasciculaceae cyanobacterium SM2_3_26]